MTYIVLAVLKSLIVVVTVSVNRFQSHEHYNISGGTCFVSVVLNGEFTSTVETFTVFLCVL